MKLKLRGLCCFLALMIYGYPAVAQGQSIAPTSLGVMTDNTGAVISPPNFWSANAASLAGGTVPTAVKTAAYTAVAGDFIPVDATSASVTITLPAAPADKAKVTIQMIATASGHTVTINAGGADVFNKSGGVTSGTLTLANQAVNLQYAHGPAIWYVADDATPLAQLDLRYPVLSSGVLPSGVFPATLPTASGVNLTALNATQLTSGTVPNAAFPATLPTASGVNLTALNATQLTSGTVPNAAFPATLPTASGVNLTALNATQLTSGTLPNARLSGVPLTANNLSEYTASAATARGNLNLGSAATNAQQNIAEMTGDETPGLVAWYKAESITPVSDGTLVSSWSDSIGGFNVTASGSARPYYTNSGIGGRPGLVFDGTANIMNSSSLFDSSFANTCTFIVVYQKRTTTAAHIIADGGSHLWLFTGVWNSSAFAGGYLNYPSGGGANGGAPCQYVNTPGILSYRANTGGVLNCRFNGLMAPQSGNNGAEFTSSTGAGTGLSGGMTIGGITSPFVGGFFDGIISEVLVYNTCVPTATLRRIEQSLMRKYGFAAQVVFIGDSITAGADPAVIGANNDMGTLVTALMGGGKRALGVNIALTGTTSVQWSNWITNVFLEVRTPNDAAYYLLGANDYSGDITAAQEFSRLSYIGTTLKRAGFSRVIEGTLMASSGATETWRTAVNSLIRANYGSYLDGVADLGSLPGLGDPSQIASATWWQGGAPPHPTLLGAQWESTNIAQQLVFGTQYGSSVQGPLTLGGPPNTNGLGGAMLEVHGVANFAGMTNLGSETHAFNAQTASYSLADTDYTVTLNGTTLTATLPDAIVRKGRIYFIKNIHSGSATVATTSSQTIDGSTTYSLSAQYKYLRVQSDGANWQVLGNN